MKKFRFAIILIALLLLFASCDGEKPAETTDVIATDAPETEPPAPQSLTFSENGSCAFYIVYPEDFDDSVKDLAISLRKQIKKYTGVELKIVGDRIMENPTSDFGVEHQYELLLGPTNREASQKAHNGMRSRDYTVTFDGDKIVLGGTTIETVEKACDRFIDFILIKQGKDNQGSATVVFKEDDIFSYTYNKYLMESCKILGADISEYAIVYDRNDIYSAERNARLFANVIQRDAGYALRLERNATEGAREIVFGGSDTVKERHGFTIRAEGTKLYVSAECMEGFNAAYIYLTETLFKGEKIEIAEGFSYSGVADVSDFPEMDLRAGEYRVIFNNIYGNHQAEHPAAARNDMNSELHLEYLPDVIGLQEASPNTTQYITFMIAHGYTRVDVKATNSNEHNYTPLLYRADKLEVIDKGYHLFDDGAGDKSKSVTWAVFKDKVSGDVFAVGATHFYWTSDELGQAARLKDAEQVSELAKQITSKYNCSFILGGDFNCRIDSAPFSIMNKEGFKNLQKISPETMDITTHHAYAAYDSELEIYVNPTVPSNPYNKAIDHALVFNESKITPKKFAVILHEYSFLSSDHCPVMVEFDIN